MQAKYYCLLHVFICQENSLTVANMHIIMIACCQMISIICSKATYPMH